MEIRRQQEKEEQWKQRQLEEEEQNCKNILVNAYMLYKLI